MKIKKKKPINEIETFANMYEVSDMQNMTEMRMKILHYGWISDANRLNPGCWYSKSYWDFKTITSEDGTKTVFDDIVIFKYFFKIRRSDLIKNNENGKVRSLDMTAEVNKIFENAEQSGSRAQDFVDALLAQGLKANPDAKSLFDL